MWSVREPREALTREEQRLGTTQAAAAPDSEQAAALEAARERAELAEAEISADHPLVNGLTLVGMHGALDALVDELVPSSHQIAVDICSRQLMDEASRRHPALADALPAGAAAAIEQALREILAQELPAAPRIRGAGVERWESVLRTAGLSAPSGRPVPAGLDLALRELTNIRDVLVHRAGRLDPKAIVACPTLPSRLETPEGDFVRLRGKHYRRYSAAVRAYGTEVLGRVIARGGIPYVARLDRWEAAYVLGT